MFIPSESVYAELHERFDDVMQRAQRARVMIVSPTLMVMAIQVIRQMRKDAQMREAADQIRTEVGHMMKDVGLLTRPRHQAQGAFRASVKGYRRHPDLGRQDRQARRRGSRSWNSTRAAGELPMAQPRGVLPAQLAVRRT